MLKIKCAINQHDLKRVDLHFVKLNNLAAKGLTRFSQCPKSWYLKEKVGWCPLIAVGQHSTEKQYTLKTRILEELLRMRIFNFVTFENLIYMKLYSLLILNKNKKT